MHLSYLPQHQVSSDNAYTTLSFILMKFFQTYLSTAPVLAALYFSFIAGLLIELNRFFPDALSFSFV